MTEEDEILEGVQSLSPLSALAPEDAAKLSARKQRFLLAVIGSGSLPKAKKAEHITKAMWDRWQTDEDFVRVLGVVQNPVAMAYNVYQVIIMAAAVEHLKLLGHPSVRVRQWAIERAQVMAGQMVKQDRSGIHIEGQLNLADVRKLIEASAPQLPEGSTLSRSPFAIVEGEIVNANSRETNGGSPSSDEGTVIFPE